VKRIPPEAHYLHKNYRRPTGSGVDAQSDGFRLRNVRSAIPNQLPVYRVTYALQLTTQSKP